MNDLASSPAARWVALFGIFLLIALYFQIPWLFKPPSVQLVSLYLSAMLAGLFGFDWARRKAKASSRETWVRFVRTWRLSGFWFHVFGPLVTAVAAIDISASPAAFPIQDDLVNRIATVAISWFLLAMVGLSANSLLHQAIRTFGRKGLLRPWRSNPWKRRAGIFAGCTVLLLAVRFFMPLPASTALVRMSGLQLPEIEWMILVVSFLCAISWDISEQRHDRTTARQSIV